MPLLYLNTSDPTTATVIKPISYSDVTVFREVAFWDQSLTENDVYRLYANSLDSTAATTSCLAYSDAKWIKCDGNLEWITIAKARKKARKDTIREMIHARMGPAIHATRKGVGHALTPAEAKARETLAIVVGPREFRRFLSHGFVSVRSPVSGRVYSIYSGNALTKVYENGKLIERLCVHLEVQFPPTDSVIVRYLMVLNNEGQLWKLANKHGPARHRLSIPASPDHRSLVDILEGRIDVSI